MRHSGTNVTVLCIAGFLLAACGGASAKDDEDVVSTDVLSEMAMTLDLGGADLDTTVDTLTRADLTPELAPADVGASEDAGSFGGEVCPVVGFEACGGDLVGTWSFVALCPEDPEAAAALCESPFDDNPECVGGGNVNNCEGFIEGTLNFDGQSTVTGDTVSGITPSWIFTDTCLEAAGLDGGEPEARCLGLSSDKLTCTYDPGACLCQGGAMEQPDQSEASYSIEGNDLQLGEDPPAAYCVDGDRLIMDYYIYHPISWRYWVLERMSP